MPPMFRLTREVRFAVNEPADNQLASPPSNSFGGYPSLTGVGQYFRVQVTLEGELNPQSRYLRNIKEIDDVIRGRAIGDVASRASATAMFESLRGAWLPQKLHSIAIFLTPFLSVQQLASEFGMFTRLSQKFEFCAAHRLHNPQLSDEENRRTYGKCNNPNWHGHNYEVQVTLRGQPKEKGLLVDVPAFEKIVQESAILKLDHKNLNVEVEEFRGVIPTVENIAMVVFRMLKNRFAAIGAELASVTVWETPKTWCEYSE
jgi:6-pyruvoyltetrahydropterin/6-carboxytetrahydropterin synthase